ncbi:MAG: asparagine synthase-related protein [Nitrospirota bacterium]
MNEAIRNLRGIIINAVKKTPYEGLLFSGGLDSSILAAINPVVTCITVSLESDAEDVYYSRLLSNSLKIKHIHRKVEIDEAIETIPEVIKILKTFDPAIPNDLVVYFGLKTAKELGINKVSTGDGSDELFGGYSFMRDIDDLTGYIKRISRKMTFSSNEIGKFFGINIVQPFIVQEVIDFSLNIPADLKIKREDDISWGKWILRKAFEDILPPLLAWQGKRPLEIGSGMTNLRQIISEKVSNEEFKENSSSIKFLNKEHFYYYKVYKKVIGKIPLPRNNEKTCPSCGAGIRRDGFHCKICGYVLNWRTKSVQDNFIKGG